MISFISFSPFSLSHSLSCPSEWTLHLHNYILRARIREWEGENHSHLIWWSCISRRAAFLIIKQSCMVYYMFYEEKDHWISKSTGVHKKRSDAERWFHDTETLVREKSSVCLSLLSLYIFQDAWQSESKVQARQKFHRMQNRTRESERTRHEQEMMNQKENTSPELPDWRLKSNLSWKAFILMTFCHDDSMNAWWMQERAISSEWMSFLP